MNVVDREEATAVAAGRVYCSAALMSSRGKKRRFWSWKMRAAGRNLFRSCNTQTIAHLSIKHLIKWYFYAAPRGCGNGFFCLTIFSLFSLNVVVPAAGNGGTLYARPYHMRKLVILNVKRCVSATCVQMSIFCSTMHARELLPVQSSFDDKKSSLWTSWAKLRRFEAFSALNDYMAGASEKCKAAAENLTKKKPSEFKVSSRQTGNGAEKKWDV